MDYMAEKIEAFPGSGHWSMEWYEILKCVSAHALRCVVPSISDSFFPILMKISAMAFQWLNPAYAIKWKENMSLRKPMT